MGRARFRARIERGEAAVLRLANVDRAVESETDNTVRELGEDAELIFAAHALRETGRMARGVTSNAVGKTALVTVHARDPESGYDYVGVTRFGHRVRRIYPHPPKQALRLTYRGQRMLRASVRGFRPRGDWAERAHPEVERTAQAAMRALARRIEAQI